MFWWRNVEIASGLSAMNEEESIASKNEVNFSFLPHVSAVIKQK
jgi:hypothetical protein